MDRVLAAHGQAARPERHDNNMKSSMIVKSGLTAVAFLLISTAAMAQSAPAGRASHPTIKPRDAQSGMASGKTQRKNGAIHSADFDRNTRGNAHGAQTPAPSQEVKKGDNPLYEDHGKSGSNPLFEGSHSATAGTGSSNGVNPRPVDQATGIPLKGPPSEVHTRQEAHTPRKHPAGVKYQDRMASGSDLGSDVYQRKHISGVKYQDRTVPGKASSTNAHTPAQMPKK